MLSASFQSRLTEKVHDMAGHSAWTLLQLLHTHRAAETVSTDKNPKTFPQTGKHGSAVLTFLLRLRTIFFFFCTRLPKKTAWLLLTPHATFWLASEDKKGRKGRRGWHVCGSTKKNNLRFCDKQNTGEFFFFIHHHHLPNHSLVSNLHR